MFSKSKLQSNGGIIRMKKKKFLGVLLACALTVGSIFSTASVNAQEFVENPVKWGERQINKLDGYDVYRVDVPAAMKVNLRCVECNGGEALNYDIYDKDYNKVKGDRIYENGVNSITLPEGTYYYHFSPYYDGGIDGYAIEFYYSISTPELTLKSLNSKAVTVMAKKGEEDVHGYEVRYRLSGKSWTTKKVEEISNLNLKLSNLKAKKYYAVQVRSYIENAEGQKYFSKWSAIKKVKVKK